ncbi:hypothetical protein KBA41_03525 [Candidatus Ozemobacteraceae bacterium]|nr:hypothetical protein [Candidatus Ozemobacteraceae bacterium]
MGSEGGALDALLEAYNRMAKNDDIRTLGGYLLGRDGKDLGDRLFQIHGELLSPVLRNVGDLKALRAVLLDAKAHADLLANKLPDEVLSRYVGAVADPETAIAGYFPAASLFAGQLRAQPHLLGRLVACSGDGLLKAVRAAFARLEPMLRKVRDIEAFAGLLPLIAGNPDVEPEGFLSAIPDIATAAGLTTGVQAFQLARELVVAKNRLVDREDWLPRCLAAVAAVPPWKTPRFAEIAALLPCGPLVKHCLHVHDLSWDTMRNDLLKVWTRVRDKAPSEKEAMRKLEEIFAREMPDVTTIPSWGSFYLSFPESMEFTLEQWNQRLRPPPKPPVVPENVRNVVLALLEISQGAIDAVSVVKRFDTLLEAERYVAEHPVRSSGHGWTGRSEYALLRDEPDGYHEVDGTRLTYPRDDTLRFG